ncbi:gyrB (nucleomorph) [Chroomonas mesostigmatica CCMP1168]|uniref:DNA gyrase subunit B n=1 Tax=Chroomonas mesostigmatica CCMP1168 TaxID=1195612 RepID=J7G8N4_9CRYP|nr:gyrB [Chroomonas mesostigmatica CCMP1168]
MKLSFGFSRIELLKKKEKLALNSPTYLISFKKFQKKKFFKKILAEETSYNAGKITVLEGLEPVRRRPGVFIGSTGIKGLHHLAYEIIDNSVDEALAGYCSDILICINSNMSLTIKDKGRGIPTDIHPVTGKTALETVLTILHAGGKFGGGGYKVSGGLHGVGVSVVNALSEFFHINTRRIQRRCSMRFVRGKTIGEIKINQKSRNSLEINGTSVNFKPDFQIFSGSFVYDSFIIGERLNELAFLNSDLKLIIEDRRKNKIKKSIFKYAGGISEYIIALSKKKSPIHPIINIDKEFKGMNMQIALQWTKEHSSENILSFVNNIKTNEGGTHLDSLKVVLTRTLNYFGRKSGKFKENFPNLSGDFIREGLFGIISVKIPEPEFEGQTKSKLGNPEIRGVIDTVVGNYLKEFFEIQNPDACFSILEKAIAAFQAAEAAKKAKELIRRKSALEFITLPGKLADCSIKNPKESEIFIVEGDSAGGSAKQARDRMFQAILPLRGKIINIEKTDETKIYKNTEIQALISALGLGTRGDLFKIDQLRYRRIIIMTDADVDGAHIRTLLLTFFYRYQRKLIENGFVYIACPPLYKIEDVGKNKKNFKNYCYSDGELEFFMSRMSKKINVQRFKGLGEMMPEQLWETTMNPSTRILKKVEVIDLIKADRIFNVLMGDKVFARKEFIQIHADKMRLENIDY